MKREEDKRWLALEGERERERGLKGMYLPTSAPISRAVSGERSKGRSEGCII